MPGSQNKNGSVPYFIKLPEDKCMCLAGLYFNKPESLSKDGGFSFVLMTQESIIAPSLYSIHHRMPVMLDSSSLEMWLDSSKNSFRKCEKIIAKGRVHNSLITFEVSDHINSIKNDGPDCILPRKDFKSKQFEKGIGRFFKQSVGNKVS